VAEAAQQQPPENTEATGLMGGESMSYVGAGTTRGFTSLVKDVGEAAGGIDGSELDYSVLKVKSGRFTLIKDFDKRYFVVAVSRSGASENVFLTRIERLLTMIEDIRRLLESRGE
jgi:outer membrane lipoprotein SlyB